eukprot:NODE_111_length_18624_cov_1.285020.p3 type:complete len:321 gc:universal NODE_111_length_18624_cov_1.285020:7638-8600(+)
MAIIYSKTNLLDSDGLKQLYMSSPMDLDVEELSFTQTGNKSHVTLDNSLELDLNSIRIDEPSTLKSNQNQSILSDLSPMRSDILTHVQSNEIDLSAPNNALSIANRKAIQPLKTTSKYNQLIIDKDNEKVLERIKETQVTKIDEKLDTPEVKPISIQQDNKIQITIDPDLIMKYLSVISKAFLTVICIFISIALLTTFYYEVNDELKMQQIERQAEIQHCYNEYQENYCDTLRAPKLQDHCKDWEKCMRQDPFKYNTMIVITKVMAKCVEHFVEVLSIKTLLFIIAILIIVAYMKKQPTLILNHQPIYREHRDTNKLKLT